MSSLSRLLATASARRAGRGIVGPPGLRAGFAGVLGANSPHAVRPVTSHPSDAFPTAGDAPRLSGHDLASSSHTFRRSFAASATATPPKPKRTRAAKKPAASAPGGSRRKAATPPPPPHLPFPILSTEDGRDPFTAFTEAAGDAFASAFGPGSGSGGGAGAAWPGEEEEEPPSSSSPSSSPLTAALNALTAPWLTPTQRQELADTAGAAWATWGFPDPASADPSGASAGFGPDGRAPDPKAAAVRTRVLDAALEHVPSLGWTDAALAAGAAAAGLSRGAAALPRRGPADLVLHFISRANAGLKKELEKNKKAKAGAPAADPAARVAAALRARLEAIIPHASTWPSALATLATRPGAAPAAASLLAALVDEVLHSVGADTAAGPDWYTKRAALAAVYAAAELHLVADGSPGFEDTWAFLEGSVRGVLGMVERVGGVVGRAGVL